MTWSHIALASTLLGMSLSQRLQHLAPRYTAMRFGLP